MKNMKRNLVIGAIVLFVAAAVYLNWSYNSQWGEADEAMVQAIHLTFTSILSSSLTTIAGFIALCFMSFKLGLDLGLVMAKGVVLGVTGCVTILPSMILLLDKPLQRTRHRPLIPDLHALARGVTKYFPALLAVFALLVYPAYSAYRQANGEVYYDLGASLPDYMEYVIAQNKLEDTFDVASTHLVLLDADVPEKDAYDMVEEMEQVDGVKYVLGIESFTGPSMPRELLPDRIVEKLQSGRWELMLVNAKHPIESYEPPQLAYLSMNGEDTNISYDYSDYRCPVDSRIAQALVDFAQGCKQAGLPVFLSSGYRSYDEQNYLYERKVGQGYTPDVAATIVARPGTSEHQTGLVCDITDYYRELKDSSLELTDTYQWLKAHCAEYGFVVRYPADKSGSADSITGIIYEPWHFRYVGVEPATYMMQNNLCLEEFLALYGVE